MLDTDQISRIASDVARARLSDKSFERVVTRPGVDSEGGDAVWITLVITPEGAKKMTGDQALDLLVDLQSRLAVKGEERHPIVEYATEEELAVEEQEFDEDVEEDKAS